MDVYRIGVTIGLTNNMSSVLAVIGRDVLGLNTKVSDVEKNFNGWAKAIGSVAGIIGGTASSAASSSSPNTATSSWTSKTSCNGAALPWLRRRGFRPSILTMSPARSRRQRSPNTSRP